jgi:hypothetical protein
VIVVRVPKSWRGPHLVKINDTFRMFGRNSKGKYIFDATEIRSAYALSDQLPERIRRWRDERLAKVIGGETPVPLQAGAVAILHLVPFSSFADPWAISAGTILKHKLMFRPPGEAGWDDRINADGYVSHSALRGDPKGSTSYCQVFRSGSLEAVTTNIVRTYRDRLIIPSVWFEQSLIEWTTEALKGLKGLGVNLPIVALLTISGANGVLMAVSDLAVMYAEANSGGLIDRELLVTPDVLFEDWAADPAMVLRPAFDAVWNACGWERSRNYDANGKWAPKP